MILLAQLSFSAESSITSRTSFNMFTWLTLKVLWVARGGLMANLWKHSTFEINRRTTLTWPIVRKLTRECSNSYQTNGSRWKMSYVEGLLHVYPLFSRIMKSPALVPATSPSSMYSSGVGLCQRGSEDEGAG